MTMMMMMIKKHAFINMYAFVVYIFASISFYSKSPSPTHAQLEMPPDTIYNGATRCISGRQTPNF